MSKFPKKLKNSFFPVWSLKINREMGRAPRSNQFGKKSTGKSIGNLFISINRLRKFKIVVKKCKKFKIFYIKKVPKM